MHLVYVKKGGFLFSSDCEAILAHPQPKAVDVDAKIELVPSDVDRALTGTIGAADGGGLECAFTP